MLLKRVNDEPDDIRSTWVKRKVKLETNKSFSYFETLPSLSLTPKAGFFLFVNFRNLSKLSKLVE